MLLPGSKSRLTYTFYYASFPLIVIGLILIIYSVYLFLKGGIKENISEDEFILLAVPLSVTVLGLAVNYISRRLIKNL